MAVDAVLALAGGAVEALLHRHVVVVSVLLFGAGLQGHALVVVYVVFSCQKRKYKEIVVPVCMNDVYDDR